MSTSPTLSRRAAKRFYNRLGARQDTQAFYENPAIELLIEQTDLASAHTVGEFGCGTGRLAARLLAEHLPPTARYWGCDLSETMVRLTRARLHPYANRAGVLLVDGSPRLLHPSASLDRLLSTYVLDLLPEQEISRLLAEARRALKPGGRLGLVSITAGQSPLAKIVMQSWCWVHSLKPGLVGGCRPLELAPFLAAPPWRLRYRRVLESFGVASEVLVVEKVERLDQTQ